MAMRRQLRRWLPGAHIDADIVDNEPEAIYSVIIEAAPPAPIEAIEPPPPATIEAIELPPLAPVEAAPPAPIEAAEECDNKSEVIHSRIYIHINKYIYPFICPFCLCFVTKQTNKTQNNKKQKLNKTKQN